MGIVSTNVAFIRKSGSGSGGAYGVDLPTHLKSLSANGGNKFVTLTLEYENTNLVTGVQINYKTGSYPASSTDGQSMTVSGAATSIKITGLTNTLMYYFRVFLYREVDGVKYYQTDITNARVTGVPRGIAITGITAKVTGTDFMVIENSGTFTLTAPKGTKITLGGGAADGNAPDFYGDSDNYPQDGGLGGYVSQFTLSDDVVNKECTLTVGATNGSKTTLKIGNTTYTSNGARGTVVNTKWGPIGGNGGKGGVQYCDDSDYYSSANSTDGEDGTGAGGGGGAGSPTPSLEDGVSVRYGGSGGNRYGNGNKGGNGGNGEYYANYNTVFNNNGTLGSSGSGGSGGSTTGNKVSRANGGGGGGGYAAGGGGSSSVYGWHDNRLSGGKGGKGVFVIEWVN